MRTFVLVLLVATSAFAAPSVLVELAPINEIFPVADNGNAVNAAVISNTWELIDAADSSVYVNSLQPLMIDLSTQNNRLAQAIAVTQALAVVGDIANGLPGDSCAAAYAINNFAAGGSAASYKEILIAYIDNLIEAAQNPLSRRYASSPVGQCAGGGRNYQFDAAWNRILKGSSGNTASLLNEEYCAAKRLYTAVSSRSNNVAADATAAAAFASSSKNYNYVAVAQFLRALWYNGDCVSTGALAKQAIYGAN